MSTARPRATLRALLRAITGRMPEGGSGTRHPAPAAAPQPVRDLEALERLPPLQRAVFALRDVFACGLPQIAAAMGCSQEACRRLAATVPAGAGQDTPRAWPRHVAGAHDVARLLAATLPALVRIGITVEQQPVDGRPGMVLRDRDGRILSALALDIADGRIHTLRVVPGPRHTQQCGETPPARRSQQP